MPEPDQVKKLSRIRNIGIMAHIDAGKTTITERILFHSGKIHKIGEVHEGQAQMDFMDQEQERGITIQSAATTVYWKEHQINIIDTPGHVDFTAEVERSLRVLDGGIVVMDGKKGVEAQTETVWRQANKYKIPRLIFVNKMDSVDKIEKFEENLKSIREKFNTVPLTVQFPIGVGKELAGVVDIVEQKAYYCQIGNKEENYQVKEIPAELVSKTKRYRQELIEAIVGYDEELGLKYLEGEELQAREIKKLLRQATLSGQHFPVFCGSAYKYVGVKLVLDGVVDYLPSPLDIAEIPVFPVSKGNEASENQKNIEKTKTRIAELETSLTSLNLALSSQEVENKKTDQALQTVKFEMEEELIKLKKQLKKTEPIQNKINCNSPLPCLALAFKIMVDNYNNKLTFFRVYAGKVLANSYIYNVNRDKQERISRLVRVHANKKEEIKEVGAGDIAAAIGLEHTITGDTFGEEKKPLLLENINFAEPVISQAIEPKTNKDKDKLRDALEKLKIQDPSFKYWIDRETRQMIIAGMGELHLEVLVERLRREYKMDIETKQRKVSYRETITKKIENVWGEYKKQTGGSGHFARVKLTFEPVVNNEIKNFERVLNETEKKTEVQSLQERLNQWEIKLEELEPSNRDFEAEIKKLGSKQLIELKEIRDRVEKDAWEKRKRKYSVSNEFVDAKKGQEMSDKDAEEVREGLEEVMSSGMLLNYPLLDVKETLLEGKRHTVDTKPGDFKQAAVSAFRGDGVEEKNQKIRELGVVLLEPIMQLEVVVPKDYMGDVLADLGRCRTTIENTEEKEGNTYITGKTPLKEILNYSTTLRQITKGRGSYSIYLSHYQKTPKEALETILKEEKL